MEKYTNIEIWVKELLAGLDTYVDDHTKQIILGRCGAKCPFTHLPDNRLLEMRQEADSEEDFLDALCRNWRLNKIKNQYYVIFDKCYCPLVNNSTRDASKTLCSCTLGNLKHKFNKTLNRDIEIQQETTILAGGDECRFKIIL